MKIEEIPILLRPREKAKLNGVSSLSDRELLALYIRNGSRQASALELADQILVCSHGLSGLRNLTRADLVSLHGIHDVKATEILALIEISKRLSKPLFEEMNVMNNPDKIANWMNGIIGYEAQEVFLVLFLDIHFNVVDMIELFKGTMNVSHIHPRDIFREAVKRNAYQIVIVHNHPSGSLQFSNADIEVTIALIQMGLMMGITIVDHILVSKGRHVSLRTLKYEIFENDVC